MEAQATICFANNGKPVRLVCSLAPLQSLEVVAAKYGFFDVDLKDNDAGKYCIVATSTNRTVSAKGATLAEAVEKMLGVFIQ